MSPLFSIVIPVYKVEAYLRKCLDSVLGQTCGEWECVCVDDGSPDRCGEILEEYAKRDARLKVIHQKNGGVSVARNAALDIATGKWVQFLDSDDSITPDFLAKLKLAIGAHHTVDAIEHTAIYCYDDGHRVYGCDGRLPPAGVIDAQEILSDPFGRRLTNLGRCSCYKIFRREVIEKHHLRFAQGIPISEDSLFAAQFYAYAGKVAICPDLAGYLRIFREGSAIMSIKPEKLIPQIRGARILYETWRKHPSKGLAVNLSAVLVALAFLGKDYGEDTCRVCRDAVFASRFYRTAGLWFVLTHGTWKMRLFAAAMLVSPEAVRVAILRRLCHDDGRDG